jgi:hypothetical protein
LAAAGGGLSNSCIISYKYNNAGDPIPSSQGCPDGSFCYDGGNKGKFCAYELSDGTPCSSSMQCKSGMCE